MFFLVFPVHLLDLGVRVIRSRHSRIQVRELLQDLLSYIVLIVVFDDFEVKLSPNDLNLSSEFLLEKLLFYSFSKVCSRCFFCVEFGVAMLFDQILALMVFDCLYLRFFDGLSAFVNTGHLVRHSEDGAC